MKFATLVLRNLGRNRRRTGLTVLSIGASLFLIATLRTVITSMQAAVEYERPVSRLVVRRATSLQDPLPEAYGPRLAQLEHVTCVQAVNWFGGVYKEPKNFFANFAVDVEVWNTMWPDYVVPPDQYRRFVSERTAAIAGGKLAKRFGWQIGDRITLEGTIFPVDLTFELVGIYEGPEENGFYFNRQYFEESLDRPGQVGTWWLLVDDVANIPGVVKTVDTMFANSDAETHTETEQAFQASFNSMLGNLPLLIQNIGLVLMIAILFVAANTVSMAARERVTEVAVLKTLGFLRRQILGIFIAEALLISLLGGLLGTLFAWFLFRVTHFDGGGFFPTFDVTPGTILFGVGVAAGIGVLSGIPPALQAARTSIVDGLRKVV